MKRFLITGGAGFIGSHLAAALLGQECEVRILDNFSVGCRSSLDALPNQKLLTVVKGDVCDISAVRHAMEGVDGVFHEAALVSVPESLLQPEASFRTNALGSFQVFEAARQLGLNKVVYASSAAVYGANQSVPLSESEVCDPLSPYALDKSYLEGLARLFWKAFGVASVGLRYFNVFGPDQRPDSPYSGVVSLFAKKALENKRPVIFGDGEQSRDFVYVDDVVKANLDAMDYLESGALIFNVGSGKETTINELWKIVCSLSGSTMDAEYAPFREGDIHRSVADIHRIGEVLGWRANVDLRDGLRKLLEDIY